MAAYGVPVFQSDLFYLSQWFQVERMNDRSDQIFVYFCGHWYTPFEGGVWRVKVTFPREYPYQYPEFQFLDRIYHPNIDFETGIVCRNVMELIWDPIFTDLTYLFLVVLPQLLSEPEETVEFLNEEAGHLWRTDQATYEARVEEFCLMYVNPLGRRLWRPTGSLMPMWMMGNPLCYWYTNADGDWEPT